MRKEKLHEVVYDAANEVLRNLNPCGIHKNEAGTVVCRNPHYSDGTLCCNGCSHLTPTGCGVRSLACKLWTCGFLHGDPTGHTATVAFEALQQVARKGGIALSGVRTTKEQECNAR